MASSRPTVGEVEISAFVKIDQRSVADGIKSIESQAKRAGSAVTKLNRPLGEITGNVTEFSKSLEASNARVLAFGASAGAIYALSRSFKFLVDSMIQVEKELKDINVILGASEKQLKGFSKELFNIAGATGQSFKTVAVAAKELSRQGLSMEQTLLRTRDALILTRLSGMDAESAVASLTAAINTFNRSMLDSTKIVNKMANVDAAFAVSTQDLAEAMKRVGSTAQDVSVDFNQLLGAVTSLQQTTARGGPVIGNGLKSIFTRIQRTDTLDQLESLGVAVRGLQGDMLPAMQVLTNLAKAFPALTKAQQAHTAETVAGVFQMNTLRALLNDLGKGYSVYEQAVRTATNSTNQAIERNEELNKTLDAQIKKLSARLIQAAKSGGDMLLGPAVQNITGVLDKVLGDAEKGSGSVGAKIGTDIAKGALEGLGKMLAGPGLIALVAVGVKIGKNLSKFLVEATLDMFNMQNASMKIAATEKVITDELNRQSVLQDKYLKGLITRRDLELQVLSAVSARSKQEAATGAFVTRTATSAVQRGGGMGPSGKFSAGRSSGHIPNFVSSAESTMERAGAVRGGYAPGSVRKTNIAGLGSVTYNSAESIKHVPGFAQPFINPPSYSRAGKAHQKKSIKETGIDPYASYGVVPNFVRYMTPTSARMKKAGIGKADEMMTMTDLVEMVRQGPGKGGRAFSVTFRDSSGAIHTQTGQRAKYEAYGKGRASHYEEDGLGYLRWNPMDQNKRAKGNNPKAFREARLDRIMNISFDKKQYSMDPTRIGPDGLPSMVLTGIARSSGHVPNFSRFGGARFPVPIMPFHGASVGKYEGYKTTKAFQKPGAKGGSSFENYRDFNNALSRTFGGNLRDNVVYPGQPHVTARSQGLASLLGPTIGVQNVLAHPAYQKFSKMATPLGFQPNKGSVTELLKSIVDQAPKNALGYYRSKDYSNLFEELVGIGGGVGLANPGFGIKGASNFMGTAGLPTVEGMIKHGGQTRFMEIKASDSADNMSRLLGKSMQLYPDKYRSLAQRYASTSDFKIIDNFLGKFSKEPKFASDMEKAAYKTGGSFIDSYMSGGFVPSFARRGRFSEIQGQHGGLPRGSNRKRNSPLLDFLHSKGLNFNSFQELPKAQQNKVMAEMQQTIKGEKVLKSFTLGLPGFHSQGFVPSFARGGRFRGETKNPRDRKRRKAQEVIEWTTEQLMKVAERRGVRVRGRGRGGSKGAGPQEGIPWPSSPGFGPGWRTGPIDHFDDLARGMTRKQGVPFPTGFDPHPMPMRPNPQFQRYIKPSVTIERNMWDVQNEGWSKAKWTGTPRAKWAIPKDENMLDAKHMGYKERGDLDNWHGHWLRAKTIIPQVLGGKANWARWQGKEYLKAIKEATVDVPKILIREYMEEPSFLKSIWKDITGRKKSAGHIPNFARFGSVISSPLINRNLERPNQGSAMDVLHGGAKISLDRVGDSLKLLHAANTGPRGGTFKAFTDTVQYARQKGINSITSESLTPQLAMAQKATSGSNWERMLQAVPQLKYRLQNGLRTSGNFEFAKKIDGIYQVNPKGSLNFSSLQELRRHVNKIPPKDFDDAMLGQKDRVGFSLMNVKTNTNAGSRADGTTKFAYSGHIPNFANNALAAAFSREKKASGLPGSQIYATTVHTPNYSGPVVGNKRDEPTYGSLRKAVMNHPDPARAGMSRGNVPNFAALDMIPGYGLFKGMQNFFDKELKDLEKQFKEDVKASKVLSQETRNATKTTQRSQARMDVLNARINDLNGLTEQANKLEQKGSAASSVLRDPGLLRQQMRSLERFSSRGLIENLDKDVVKTLKTQVSALLGDTLTTRQKRSVGGTMVGETGFKVGELLRGKGFFEAKADLEAREATLRGTAGFRDATRSQKNARNFLKSMGVDTKGMVGNEKVFQAMKAIESSVDMASKKGQNFQRIMVGLEARDVQLRKEALNQFATQVATGRLVQDKAKGAKPGDLKQVTPGLKDALNAFSMAKGGLLFDKKGAPIIDPRTGEQRTTKLTQQQAARQATLERAREAEEEKRQKRDTASRQAGETKQSMRQQRAMGTGFGGFMARNPMIGMQAGMALSFLGPMAGGAMAQALGGPTKAQRRNAAIAQGVGTTVGYAATGGMMASMAAGTKAGAMGGPKGMAIGAAIGAAIGIAQSLFTVSDAMESISSDVRQAYEAENKAKEEAASATSKFVKSQNAYIEAMERGAGAQTLDALKQKTIESLVQIGDPNLTRKLLAAGNDPNKVADVNAEIQRKNEAQKKIFGERGAIEQMVNAGKAETISEAGLKAIASDIALFGDLGKGPVTEASLKKAGIDTSSDLLEGFADLMDGDVVDALIVFIEAKRKEIAAAKGATGAQTASAKALLRLKEASMAAISAKEADLRLADLFHSGATKMREVVNGLEQNVSSFRTMDKQLKLSIENNKRSLVMDNTILMQRAGQSLLAQGTKGVTSGFGTSGQQAMGQLGGILMAGNLGPAKTMQQLESVLNNILNDPTISQKDKSGIQQQMDKLATEMAENTAKTAIQNNLIELQTAVEKSNIDFRQRMNMQGQGLGGGGNGLGFMNAVLSLSGQQSGALNRSQELGARAQGFETLRGMGFDLNRGGLGDTFRNFKADRFKSEAADQLDFLLGDPKLTKKLIDPNTSMKEAESLIRGANSKQGDIVNQIVRTLKSPEIDKARSNIEGSIQKEQATLQSSLVDIIGGNTQMLNQLIQSQSQLIDSNGNLAMVLKTMPKTLAQTMGEIMSGYNQQQVNQAAGKAGATMMQMNAGKLLKNAPLQRFLNPKPGIVRGPNTGFTAGENILQTEGFQNLFSTKGTGIHDVIEIAKAGGAASYRLDENFRPNQRFQQAFSLANQGKGVRIPAKLSTPRRSMVPGQDAANSVKFVDKLSGDQKDWINNFRAIMKSKSVTSSKNATEFDAAVRKMYETQGGIQMFGMSSDDMVALSRSVVQQEGLRANMAANNQLYPALNVTNPQYQQSASDIVKGGGNLANILTGTGGAVNPRTGMALPASTNLQGMQKHLSNMLARQKEFSGAGDTPNAQAMGRHIQKLQNHMMGVATRQGLVNPQFQGGMLVHQPQAHAQGGGLVPLAAPGAPLPAGATLIPTTPANTAAQGLSQQAQRTAGAAQAAAQRTQTLIDQLSATTQLGNFAGTADTTNIKEFIEKAATGRANQRLASELLIDQQEGAIMAQGGSAPSFRRQANRGILEKQASVLQEAIATAQQSLKTEEDTVKQGQLMQTIAADKAALTKIETELSENYIKERAEEIEQLKRRGTLIQELNGGLAMGHTAEQQLLSETQARTQQLMQDIMTGRENGKTEEELADKKKELKELFAQTPAQEFNSALSAFIQETNRLRGELEDGSAKRKAIAEQKRGDLDLDTQLMREREVNRNPLAMSMQKKREQLGIEKARTAVMTGAGTHGQLAQAQNAATTAALRRGDIDVGEALRRQMASKVMANKGDYKEQILNDVADLSNKMSGHFASAWESFVTGASSGKDALKGFASAVAMEMQRLLFKHTIGRVMDNVFASAFGALGAASSAGAGARQAGGYIPKRYNSGGMVTGGSGYKDDVPAMMSGGEFVIRKSSVNKYGSDFMNALNSGSVPKMNKGGPSRSALMGEFSEVDFESAPTFAGRSGARGNFSNARSRGVSMGLANAFLMNDPDRPGRGFSRVNRRLSNRALRSDFLVQSKFRRSRADKFMSYHEYLRGEFDRRQEARQNFRDQKAGALQAGMINAAVSGVIAGGMTYRNLTRGADGVANEAQEYYDQGLEPPSGGPAYIPPWAQQTARGGLIKRFAMGGSNRDSVPALLMGGEYVMNRQATNKYGTSFMNRLNRGQISRFQNGGYVGGTGVFDGAGQVDNALSSDKIVRLVDLTENINRLMEESSVKEAEVREGQNPDSPESSSGGIVNHINISINTAAGQPAEADVETKTEASGGDQADDQSTERSIEDNEKLADSLRSVVLDTIVKEQRPGGLLSK